MVIVKILVIIFIVSLFLFGMGVVMVLDDFEGDIEYIWVCGDLFVKDGEFILVL